VRRLPVRVRVRLRSLKNNRVLITSALLNTGFTTNELDIHIPQELAEQLGLWPPPKNAVIEVLDTAGGEVLSYYIPRAVELTVIEEDRTSRTLVCNAIVSLYEKEVLLSDAVIEELEIEILSPRTGIWRFRGEKKKRFSI